jgi:hypothetical protein
MKITLFNSGAYFDGETFTICNEPLVMEVVAEVDNLYAVCTLGNKRTTIKVKDGVLSIPPAFLEHGELHIGFKQVENGNIIKEWRAERVTLHKRDDEYKAIPELVMLRNELTTVKKALKELYGLINKNNQI